MEERRARALDVHLADRVRALVVAEVVQRLVEAELDVREETEILRLAARVADGRPPDLDVVARRHEEAELDLDAVLRTDDARIPEPVAAFVPVERRPGRLPARVPDRPAVVDVEVAAHGVERDVVVAVAGQSPQPRVTPEGVAPAGVRAEAEKVVLTEVVEPWQRRVRPRDHILARGVVERAVPAGHASNLGRAGSAGFGELPDRVSAALLARRVASAPMAG
jgi:hypothetical protein